MNEQNISSLVAAAIKDVIANSSSEMTLQKAKKLALLVEQEAERIGVKAVVAVSNSAARPVLVECMDDSYIASYDVAFNKAYTVVALKMSTSKLKGLSQPNEPLYGIQFTNQGQIVIFGGGEPLYVGGKIVGGLGVSGGSEEQDTYLAEFGAKAWEEL
ncbi:MAG: heme-binding protein [Clostridia bacterium]|nr:heme-binding protein [Clostridia bacterium]